MVLGSKSKFSDIMHLLGKFLLANIVLVIVLVSGIVGAYLPSNRTAIITFAGKPKQVDDENKSNKLTNAKESNSVTTNKPKRLLDKFKKPIGIGALFGAVITGVADGITERQIEDVDRKTVVPTKSASQKNLHSQKESTKIRNLPNVSSSPIIRRR
jgi:hypothetical protein